MDKLLSCELLCYLSHQYDKVDRECLISTVSDFYTLEESLTAKQLIIDECEKLGLTDSIGEFKKRRQNAKGDGNLKVVKDSSATPAFPVTPLFVTAE